MANRYDRDPDDYGFGRRDARDASRDDDDHRQGQSAQGARNSENRQGPRQNPWRDVRNERDRNDQEYRARLDADQRNANVGRGLRDSYGDNNYYAGRENNSGRDYYSTGRDYDSSYDRDRTRQYDPQRGDRSSSDRGAYRGVYQEQVWTRDPNSGNVYGYEYTTRVDPRRYTGEEGQDRSRPNVNDQNRRFDIDRGWHTPGTSGYGNSGNVQSQYGKGPKGYTRSDERIREDVCDRLSDDDEVDARDITVTVKNAEVVLEGTVNDRRSKHRAEDVAESVSGVKDVSNHLRARKGLLQELGDKISGDDDAEHHGHRGSGTRNSATPGAAPQKSAH